MKTAYKIGAVIALGAICGTIMSIFIYPLLLQFYIELIKATSEALVEIAKQIEWRTK